MKVRLRNLFDVIALTDSQVATQIEQLTGQHFTSDLITRAADGQPISAIAADSICTWLSKQFGKEIKPTDIADLNIHPLSSLPASSADTEEGRQEMLAYLKVKGYTVTPPALQPDPMYEDGDYLKGDLAPRNWQALANRRVPWPEGMDPKQALHELAPFMVYRLLSEQATQRGRDVSTMIRPDEDI